MGSIEPTRQLVEQAVSGCSDSFAQLVELYHKQVRLYLGKYIQCSAQVDDVAQEVFVTAFSQLSRFRNEAKFSTWLIGIARNKALECLKGEIRTRKKQRQFFEAEIAKRQISRLEMQQRESELDEKRLWAMQICLEQLPDPLRALIDNYYFEQQTADDIAAKSKVTVGSVRMKLLRVRRILQKCIVARLQGTGGNLPVLELKNERK